MTSSHAEYFILYHGHWRLIPAVHVVQHLTKNETQFKINIENINKTPRQYLLCLPFLNPV